MDVDLKLGWQAALAWPLTAALASAAHALGPQAPFTPPAAASAAAGASEAVAAAPVVSGLTGLRLGQAPQALIDGSWYRSGDVVRGARLIAVTRRGVTLRHADGHAEQLSLLPPATTQRGTP